MSLHSSTSFLNVSLAASLGDRRGGPVEIKFPFKMDWYNERPCKSFQSLEHRKEITGLRHEFIVLNMTDGSICRIERMGDPTARFDALSAQGSLAHDLAQCFPPQNIADAHLDTSERVAKVIFPHKLDLMDVLKICRAIHECDKTRNYTLRGFNCYFFCLAIQCCLTRLVAKWEAMNLDSTWEAAFRKAVDSLPEIYSSNDDIPHGSSLRRLFAALDHVIDVTSSTRFVEEAQRRLSLEIVTQSLGSALNRGIPRDDPRFNGDYLVLERAKQDILSALIKLFSATDINLKYDYRPHRIKQHDWLQHKRPPNSRGRQKRGWVGSLKGPALMDYRGAYTDVNLQSLNVTQWVSIGLSHSRVWVLWILHLILGLCGATALGVYVEPIQRIDINSQLARVITELEKGLPSATRRKELRQEVDAWCDSPCIAWSKQPGWEIQRAIAKRLPSQALSTYKPIRLKVQFAAQSQPKAMTVFGFQQHILRRIELQAKLVERVKLGSASKIQVELQQMLAQVWQLIREDKNVINVRWEAEEWFNELVKFAAEMKPKSKLAWQRILRSDPKDTSRMKWKDFDNALKALGFKPSTRRNGEQVYTPTLFGKAQSISYQKPRLDFSLTELRDRGDSFRKRYPGAVATLHQAWGLMDTRL